MLTKLCLNGNMDYENDNTKRTKNFKENFRVPANKTQRDMALLLQNQSIKIEGGETDTHIMEKQKEREERRQRALKPTEGQIKTDYIPVSKEALSAKRKKQHNRSGYKMRKPFGNWRIPIFDLRTKIENPYDRLNTFNRRNKCSHGKRFNKLTLELDHITPHYKHYCDHKGEKKGETTDISCYNCAQQFFYKVKVRESLDCSCDVYECGYCKYRVYKTSYFIPDREGEEYKEKEIKTQNIVCCCLGTRRQNFEDWKRIHMKETIKPRWGKTKSDREEFLDSLRGITKPETRVETVAEEDFPPLESLHINSGKATGGVVTKSYDIMKITAIEVLTTVKEQISGLIKKFSEYYNKAETIVKSVKILDRIKTFLSGLLGTLKELIQACVMQPGLALVLSISMYKYFTEGGRLNLLGLMGSAFTLYQNSDVNFFGKLFAFFEDYMDDHATSGESTMGKALDFLQLLSRTILGTATDFVSFKSTPTLLNFIRDFNSKILFGKSVGTLFYKIIGLMPNAIRCLFIAQTPEAALSEIIKDETNPVGIASRKAVALKLAYAIGQQEDVHICEHEMTKAYENALDWIKTSSFPYSWTLMRFMDSLQRHVRNTNSGRDLEKEPLVIRISGDAGVGKSTLAPYLLRGLYPNLTMAEIRAKIYTRNAMATFWDGWNNQKHEIVLYDDFGQSREELDFIELILMASSATYRPEFANVDPQMVDQIGLKGTIVNPKVIILCSNQTVWTPKHITSADAINRRQHVHVHMTFASNDLTPKADFSHCLFELKGCAGETFETIGTGQAAVNWCTALVETIGQSFEEKLDKLKKQNVEMKYEKPQNFQVPDNFKGHMSILSAKRTTFKRNVTTNTVFQNPLNDNNNRTPAQGLTVVPNIDEVVNVGHATSGLLEGIGCLAAKLFPSIVSGMSVFNTVYFFGQNTAHMLVCTRTAWDYIGGFAAGVAGILAFKGAWDLIKSVATSGHTNTAKYVAPKVGLQARASGAQDEYFKFISKNCAYVRTANRFQNCMYVRGNVIMFNLHFLTDNTEDTLLPEGTEIFVTEVGKEPRGFNFHRENMYIIPDRDMVLYKLPIQFQQKKDITAHFTDGTESLTGKAVTAVKVTPDMVNYVHARVRKDQVELVWIDDRGYKHYGRDTFTVDMPAPDGDCGSPTVLTNNTSESGRIVGIVTAAIAGGYTTSCQVITRDMLEKGLSAFEMTAVATSGLLKKLSGIDIEECDDARIKGALRVYGKIPYKVRTPTKSKIVKSPLYEEITLSTTKPAKLYFPGRDLVMEGINKYSEPPKDLKHIDAILEAQLEIFRDNKDVQIFPRILTWSEVVNGVPNYPYIDSMDMSTSVGFPLIMTGAKKKDIFPWNETSLKYEITEKMEEDLQLIEDHLAQGLYMDLPFVGTLKDERRPNEKVAQGKTRYFSASSLYNMMFLKRYFAPIISAMFQSRNETYVKVGIDKISEWDGLAKSLLSLNTNIYDCDYTAFDSKLSPNVAQAWIDFCLTWLSRLRKEKKMFFTDRDFKIMRALLYSDANPLHLVEDLLVMISSGNSSGSYFTTAKNCFVNVCYMMETWIERVPLMHKGLHNFRLYVSAHTFGDDLIFSVDPFFEEFFNDKTHSETMSQYGITVTPAIKEGGFGAKKIQDVQFLKHKFVKIYGMYYPLQMEPFEQINWIRRGKNSPSAEEACELNCNAALYAAFFHGRKFFQEHREKILAVRPNYNLVTYAGLAFEFNATGKITDAMNVYGYSQHRPKITMEEGFVYPQMVTEDPPEYEIVTVTESEKRIMEAKATNGNLSERYLILYDSYHGFWIRSRKEIAYYIETWEQMLDADRRCLLDSLFDLIMEHHEDVEGECEMGHPLCSFSFKKQIEANKARGTHITTDWTWLVYESNKNFIFSQAIGYVGEEHPSIVGEVLPEHIVEKPQNIWRGLEEMEIKWGIGLARATSGKIGETSGTLDEAAAITTTQVGVHLSEQKEATLVKIPGGFSSDVRSQKYNNDVNWDLEKTQQRYNLVEQIKWQVTDAEMTLLRTYDVMKDLIKNDLMDMPFSKFHAFRCKQIRARFEVIGYRFCNGSLMVWFERTHVKKELNELTNDKTRITQLNPAFVLPNAGTVVDFVIPFNYHRQYLNLNDADTMGQLKIMVNSPFESVDGSNTYCIVKLYVQIEGAEFRQPKLGLSQENRMRIKEIEKRMASEKFALIGRATSGVIESLIDSGAGALKDIVKNALPDELSADVFAGLLDAPQIANQPHFVELKPTQFLSNIDIPRYMENLTYKAATTQLTDKDIAGVEVDEMSFQELFKRWSHVGQFDITTASTGNVFKKIIGPNSLWFEQEVPHTPATAKCLTIMDFVANHFEYWRGGTEVKLKAFCSPMHEFKLTIYYIPWHTDTSVALDEAQLSTQYFRSHVFRNEDNEVTVILPDLGDTPVRKVYQGQDTSDVDGQAGQRSMDYFIGHYRIEIEGTINFPASVPPTARIEVYERPAQDFRVFMTTLTGSSWQPTNQPLVYARATSGSMPVKTLQTPTNATMLAAGDGFKSDVSKTHFGEEITGFKDMLKRFNLAHHSSTEVTLTANQLKGIDPFVAMLPINALGPLAGAVNPINTVLGRITPNYRSIRGGLSYKIAVRMEVVPTAFTTPPRTMETETLISPFTNYGNLASIADAATMQSNVNLTALPTIISKNGEYAEFRYPFMQHTSMALLEQVWDRSEEDPYVFNQYFRNLFVLSTYMRGFPAGDDFHTNYKAYYIVDVYIAINDETRLLEFVGIQPMYVKPSITDPSKCISDYWHWAARKEHKKTKTNYLVLNRQN